MKTGFMVILLIGAPAYSPTSMPSMSADAHYIPNATSAPKLQHVDWEPSAKLKFLAAGAIRQLGMWCPTVTQMTPDPFKSSMNRNVFRVDCTSGSGKQEFYYMTMDANYKVLAVEER